MSVSFVEPCFRRGDAQAYRLLILCILGTGSCQVAKAGFELRFRLLSWPPKYCDFFFFKTRATVLGTFYFLNVF